MMAFESKLKNETFEPKDEVGLVTPYIFGGSVALLVALWKWPRNWLFSGAAILTFSILLGSSKGYRVLPRVPLWTLLSTINLAYAISATSWLLYGVFCIGCYPSIFLTCLFQFDNVAHLVRRNLRLILRHLHFIDDKIAFFNIPALEIDTEVSGLMVIRGLTISLSSLSIVVHGVEVGIKLSSDIELAIQTAEVNISLFRGIWVGDCYANVKGGEYEMTFGGVDAEAKDEDGDTLMVEETPLLRAATLNGDKTRPGMVKMTSRMTNGQSLRDSSPQSGLRSVQKLSPEDLSADKEYQNILKWIDDTDTIGQCRRDIERHVLNLEVDDTGFDHSNEKDLRAAICSKLHNKPSVPHAPKRAIKVTTLRNLSSPRVKELTHRLPMLLRLLLNPISYFHPVKIQSVTAVASGKWITHILKDNVFKNYSDNNSELRKLEKRVSDWLSDASFAIELDDITGLAQVPFLSSYDIRTEINMPDVIAYRTLPRHITLKQVVRLGGADAVFRIPSFLLPHHEHLLPPIPTVKDKDELASDVDNADGKPNTVQAQKSFEQAEKDEANVTISVHARLPACFDQELLNFVSALVKATKVVELEKEPNIMDKEMEGFKDFTQTIGRGMRDGMKKAAVDSIINDRWIAKMVGKITKKLERAQGDLGYSGDIPVDLGLYRLPEGSREAKKIWP